jgi:hypothetical protein
VRSRISLVALALTTMTIPGVAQAQKPVPIAPSELLTQREELDLTPKQVRELSLLAAQAHRYQMAVLFAPSKPWIASARGTAHDVAAERALALLSPEQRVLASKTMKDSVELASKADPAVLLD